MAEREVFSDERSAAVERSALALGYKFVAFALLMDVAWRGWRYGEAAWDLLGIVISSGLVLTAYQARQRTINRCTTRTAAIAALVGAAVAAAAALLLR